MKQSSEAPKKYGFFSVMKVCGYLCSYQPNELDLKSALLLFFFQKPVNIILSLPRPDIIIMIRFPCHNYIPLFSLKTRKILKNQSLKGQLSP